jgi:hypothetical protein
MLGLMSENIKTWNGNGFLMRSSTELIWLAIAHALRIVLVCATPTTLLPICFDPFHESLLTVPYASPMILVPRPGESRFLQDVKRLGI